MSLDTILCKLTGRRFRYNVTLRYYYRQPESPAHIERVSVISTTDRREVVNPRKLKRFLSPALLNDTPRELKRNGSMVVSNLQYLGWF